MTFSSFDEDEMDEVSTLRSDLPRELCLEGIEISFHQIYLGKNYAVETTLFKYAHIIESY